MAHYSGDQLQIPLHQQVVVKQEVIDESYEDYKCNISVDQHEFKQEVEDREISDYEFRIKEELEKLNERNVCVKEECNYEIIKTEEIDIKEEVVDNILIEYECLICDTAVFDKNLLLSHILNHGKHCFCKICRRSFPRSSLKCIRHKCIPYEHRPFECDICQKRYTEKNNLRRHQKVHNPGKVVGCNHCLKHFNSKHDLLNHKRYHKEKKDKPFLCDMCHKRYYQLCHLERHQMTHTGEKPFKCEICHKRFADNTNLTNHRRSHTDERSYECKVCHKWFKTSSNLINHMRIHTDERPYKCNICEKTFRKNSNLTSHQKVHRINQMIDDFDLDTKNPQRRGHNVKRERC